MIIGIFADYFKRNVLSRFYWNYKNKVKNQHGEKGLRKYYLLYFLNNECLFLS